MKTLVDLLHPIAPLWLELPPHVKQALQDAHRRAEHVKANPGEHPFATSRGRLDPCDEPALVAFRELRELLSTLDGTPPPDGGQPHVLHAQHLERCALMLLYSASLYRDEARGAADLLVVERAS